MNAPSPGSNNDPQPEPHSDPPRNPEVLSPEEWVEDYLDRLTAPMIGTIPYPVRCEKRREVKSHLEEMIEAMTGEGKAPEEAADEALSRFGDPRKCGVQMAMEWASERTQELPSIYWRLPMSLLVGMTAGPLAALPAMAAAEALARRLGIVYAHSVFEPERISSLFIAGLLTGLALTPLYALVMKGLLRGMILIAAGWLIYLFGGGALLAVILNDMAGAEASDVIPPFIAYLWVMQVLLAGAFEWAARYHRPFVCNLLLRFSFLRRRWA